MIEYEVRVDKEFGSTHWYLDGKRHREDGPAVEYVNGHREWYIDGKKHRLDGPAVIGCKGKYREWWVNGEEIARQGVDGTSLTVVINGVEYLLEGVK